MKNQVRLILLGVSLLVIVVAACEYIKAENKLSKERETQLVVFSEKPVTGIRRYTVASADSIISIANKYNISVNTIIKANNLNNENLTTGQELLILPITGLYHIVLRGENFETISTLYGVDKEAIVNFPGNEPLSVGQTLIIPTDL